MNRTPGSFLGTVYRANAGHLILQAAYMQQSARTGAVPDPAQV